MDAGMTRASAVPARGSASLPPSERSTPKPCGLGERCGSVGNLRASDFGEKIRQLEQIGNRLRGEVDVILRETNTNCRHPTRPLVETEKSFDEVGTSFRELTDISNEQHTIEAMKAQLEHLQHRLREPVSVLPSYPSLPISPKVRVSRPRHEMSLPTAVLERELRDSRDRCSWLEAQLIELQHQLAATGEQYNSNTEELKARLFELQQHQQQTLQLREEEQKQQTELVTKLRESLAQLQDANREQEHTLLETNGKLDMAQQNHYVLESSLAQVRSLLHGVEQRRQRPFFDSDPVPRQSASLLAHTLERYIQESECELDNRNAKLQRLEAALEETKRAFVQEKQDLEMLWRDRMHALSMEADAKAAELRNDEASAVRRADDLETQLRQLRGSSEEAIQRANYQLREAETRLAKTQSELETGRSAWSEKRTALESALDSAQRETASVRNERDLGIAQVKESETKVQGLRSQLAESQALLEEEHRSWREDCARGKRAEVRLTELEQELETKRLALANLETAMEALREETALEIARVKADGKTASEIQTRALTDRLAKAETEKAVLASELQSVRDELCASQRGIEEAAATQRMLCIQFEGAQEEKTHLQGIIGNRSAEVERLTAERDFYFRCLDEKTEEVSLLKAEKQRLVVQVSEKLQAMERAHGKLEDRMIDLTAKSRERDGSHGLEKETLIARMAENERSLEEVHVAREQLQRKLKAKDKETKEVERERERMRTELEAARGEGEALFRERAQLYEELRESRRETLALANDLEAVRSAGADRELQMEQKVQELTGRLRAIEEEATTAKTRGAHEKRGMRVGTRLMRDAPTGGSSKAQMEGVKARLRELEGRIATVENERLRLKTENDRLCRLLQRVTSQNEKLSGELEYYVTRSQDLRDRLSASEAARERLSKESEESRQQMEVLELVSAKSKAQAATLSQRLEALRKASAGVVAKASAANRVTEGEELRSMLADVRTILSSQSRPFGDQQTNRESPVGSLLLDGADPDCRNGRGSS